jgi:hypothetical protein
MERFLELGKDFFKEWGGLRILLNQNRAQLEAEMILGFDKAKRMSDFIGMIVRLTFLMVFVAYFVTKTKLSTSWWWWYYYGSAVGFGLIFTFYFGFLIIRIVLQYFLRDVVVHTNPWIKALMLVINIYFYYVVASGIIDIAQAIARATKLTP